MALSDTRIRNARPAKAPFKITDGEGLLLEVRPTGRKLWRYRFRLHGKENTYALGEYPGALPPQELAEAGEQRRAAGYFLLAEARRERDKCREMVRLGVNPAGQKKLTKLASMHSARETFDAVAREWMKAPGRWDEWSDSYRKTVERVIDDDLSPELGPLPMRDIKPAHLLGALKKIEKRGARSVAARARFLSSEIWRYAIATQRADSDLAAALRGAIKMPETESHPALKRHEIPALLSALGAYSGHPQTAIALRLLLLLFTRPSELIEAPWDEFDLDGAMWTIPKRRMKMGVEHLVPLPSQAVELLRGLKFITGDRKHVFPHRDKRDESMTDAALRTALRVMGFNRRLTPHGMRATASSALAELGYDERWIEKQLAHEEASKVKKAYNRAIFLEERRTMLQAWADLIDSMAKGSQVAAIRAKRA